MIELPRLMQELNWTKMHGLIPAIIQDSSTLQVLMCGYMNPEALEKTYETGRVTFYSRQKQRLWTKGETSGHTLLLVDIQRDCDDDALLILVKPNGPCCHRNTQTCFGAENFIAGTLNQLEMCIKNRYLNRPEGSYVSQLFNKGTYHIAQKVGEEGVEVALASVSGSNENTINEAADLIFHLLVLLQQCHIEFSQVLAELTHRQTLEGRHK
jgi:phosphoribosyl-AMP cyclohydrolase / phosphoribosyl-ATP pyrophosphohydrolase